ncbi:hypothetical protein D8674_014383 [Pyrus ussuriensis x Pyrus communis]|uniref:Uncharacterized protein n=1 Tax=Pyrus ussuriensis x Pyrus communis TaxID=2448454 RepID=A0A5N5H5V0_9ROSA|nr:hypothetical protein D8674_014383 [Pyrus ussuriensis x Pyrus communis]
MNSPDPRVRILSARNQSRPCNPGPCNEEARLPLVANGDDGGQGLDRPSAGSSLSTYSESERPNSSSPSSFSKRKTKRNLHKRKRKGKKDFRPQHLNQTAKITWFARSGEILYPPTTSLF